MMTTFATRAGAQFAASVANKLSPWMLHWAEARAAARIEQVMAGGEARPRHVMVAICDHYEPMWTGSEENQGAAPRDIALARVAAWRQAYPALCAGFRDADGRPPRHTFFFPGEQYEGAYLEPLAELTAQGLGEVEVHLHHDGDTRESLAEKFKQSLVDFARHGLVPKVRGEFRWAFIHGNWCLANSREDGRYCGVDDELDLLWELGCYADFTFPSAPSPTQPNIVNTIYYPSGDVRQRKAHERGKPITVGTAREDRVMCVQGPIALARRYGPGLPFRIESAALTARDPATLPRLRTWIEQGVAVKGRPEWVFVKLSTHGAPEREAASLLGAPQRRFHESLAQLARRDGFKVHYVTAREMFNIARAGMDGKAGDPGELRDYEIPPPERALA
jgi:hypothetical protein